MIKEKAGIKSVHKLYLQLLYRCNFNCGHCFHGSKLLQDDRFELPQVKRLVRLFTREFNLKSIVLLGGEPFLHPELDHVLSFCKKRGIETVVCTNGYRIGKMLHRVSPYLDHLRVSLEGVGETNDAIRRQGSFEAAMDTISLASRLSLQTSVTVTVTSANVEEIFDLGQWVRAYGVMLIKLHRLRLVGNAQGNKQLQCSDVQLNTLAEQVRRLREELGVTVLLDEDLDSTGSICSEGMGVDNTELERVEVQPSGELYVSCKAVGNDSNAFWLDHTGGRILYYPKSHDELATHAPQVRYARIP